MSLINEYLSKKMNVQQLQEELQLLIAKYNAETGRYLFVYSAAMEKKIPEIALGQEDYYVIADMLRGVDVKELDFYIETPGGSGQSAEEIVKFLRSRFESIHFVIAGEAKSAGTILVLSGDEIKMTNTGSLGPIDAQMNIGRSVISAYDYMEWVEEKRKEANKHNRLNPFDITMIAQITPGELGNVKNALEFAKDLVTEWLVKYKFKDWNETETRRRPVTIKHKKIRAKKIARDLTNRSKWRLHGRSIKIGELQEIGLRIKRIDDEEKVADIVYRIHMVCRLLFMSSPTFKLMATTESKIFRNAAKPEVSPKNIMAPKNAEVAIIEFECPGCRKKHKFIMKFVDNKDIDANLVKKGFKFAPKDGILRCECGLETDISHALKSIEHK